MNVRYITLNQSTYKKRSGNDGASLKYYGTKTRQTMIASTAALANVASPPSTNDNFYTRKNTHTRCHQQHRTNVLKNGSGFHETTPSTSDSETCNGVATSKHNEHKIEASEKKKEERRSFIRQMFHHKPNESDGCRTTKALWSAFNVTDSVTHSSEEKRDVEKKPIPVILINGMLFDDNEQKDKIDTTSNYLACSVGGEGLQYGKIDIENEFYIETESKFDKNKLHVSIKGPKQRPIKIETSMLNRNVCKFLYWPKRVGWYTIYIQWERKHVIGSPFEVVVTDK
ncbi:uncharacterized protein LOC130655440 [Hydractinia symbiolongicarpus]|uniref:uncharacterized protein LOC130655440 n=1 Tax=Hydractinia symbiolongicarpus TaxID=13093 RepID=UPI00254FD3DB|nr:uncharacterized protein LOC130655440 [Hydractinia symbiolongicarpus]